MISQSAGLGKLLRPEAGRTTERPFTEERRLRRQPSLRNPHDLAALQRADATTADHGAEADDLTRHPLTQQGYPSIWCATCTLPVAAGEDPRAGRWAGQNKTECGLHS